MKFLNKVKIFFQIIWNNLSKIKDCIIIVSTIMAIILGFNTINSWKFNVLNPVRNEIVKKQVNDLIEQLDFIRDKEETNVFGDTPYVTLLYYLKQIDNEKYFNNQNDYTRILERFYKKITNGNYRIGYFPQQTIIKNGKYINIDTIFISQNIEDYQIYLRKVINDPYVSTSIRDNAKNASDILIEFQGVILPNILVEILNSDLNNSEFDPEKIISVMNNKTSNYEDQIKDYLRKMKIEMIQILRISELYEVSK